MTEQIPTAQKTQTTFRQDCSVRCDIHAPADKIWSLLTNASMIRGTLPDFGPPFEAFARDLKRAAEGGAR